MVLLLGKVLMLSALLARLFWRPVRGRQMIRRWAASHRYTVLAIRSCRFFRGPFVTTKELGVYRVVMKVEGNKQRVAWIQCGTPLRGLASHTMLVTWEDAASLAG